VRPGTSAPPSCAGSSVRASAFARLRVIRLLRISRTASLLLTINKVTYDNHALVVHASDVPEDDANDVDDLFAEDDESDIVSIPSNPFDRASADEREAIQNAFTELLRALFSFYDRVRRTNKLKAEDFKHIVIGGVLPKSYAHQYSAEFMMAVIVAAGSLSQKVVGPTLFDLSSTIEEMLFASLRHFIDEGADRTVYDELQSSAYQDWDFSMHFDREMDGFEHSPAFRQMDLVNMEIDKWFDSFGNVSMLNAAIGDDRWTFQVPPVQHRLYDEASIGRSTLRYSPARIPVGSDPSPNPELANEPKPPALLTPLYMDARPRLKPNGPGFQRWMRRAIVAGAEIASDSFADSRSSVPDAPSDLP